MAHKVTKNNLTNTPTNGLKVKNWRKNQPPLELPNSDSEAPLVLDEDEPSFRDMKMLATITTKLSDHDARLDEMTPWADIPAVTTEPQAGPSLATTDRDHLRVDVRDGQDQFDKMEEQVHRRVAKHLKGSCNKAEAQAFLGIAPGGTIHNGTIIILSTSQAVISKQQNPEKRSIKWACQAWI